MATRWRHTETRQARGYGVDWQRLRLQILAAEPLCRMCAEINRVTGATEVDHIVPFNGIDDPLRLDPANLRPLCTPCHRKRTAVQASGQMLPGVGLDGVPLDPTHPWQSGRRVYGSKSQNGLLPESHRPVFSLCPQNWSRGSTSQARLLKARALAHMKRIEKH